MKKAFLHFNIFIATLSLPAFSLCQNVGVGTTTPAFKLDVRTGSINTDSVYRINSSTVLAISDPGNVFVGRQAGLVNIGSFNVFAGHAAGSVNTSGSFNSFFGANAGLQNTTGSHNCFFGMDAGFAHLTGWNNSFFGMNAGSTTNSGFGNSFFGYNSGIGTTTGYSNVAMGTDALYNNTTGHNNVAIGDSTLYHQTGTSLLNVAIGSKAGYSTTSGDHNLFIGYQSGFSNTIAGSNTFAGSLSGYANTSGEFNAFFGSEAGTHNTTGTQNAFFGEFAGVLTTTGSNNCFFGEAAGSNNVSGTNLTMLGRGASPLSNAQSYAAVVGADAKVGCNNCLALGGTAPSGTQTRVGINNITPLTDLHIIQQTDANLDNGRGIRLQRPNGNQWRVFLDPSSNYIFQYNNNLFSYIEPVGGTFINNSDERLKKDILPLNDVVSNIMQLRPKTYHYISSNDDRHYYGFLAQEVEKLFPEFVFSSEGGIKGIAYSNFSVIAIKAIQEQQEQINKLEKKNQEQEQQLNILLQRVETLEKKFP